MLECWIVCLSLSGKVNSEECSGGWHVAINQIQIQIQIQIHRQPKLSLAPRFLFILRCLTLGSSSPFPIPSDASLATPSWRLPTSPLTWKMGSRAMKRSGNTCTPSPTSKATRSTSTLSNTSRPIAMVEEDQASPSPPRATLSMTGSKSPGGPSGGNPPRDRTMTDSKFQTNGSSQIFAKA